MMKTFLLNLDKDVERLKTVDAELTKLQVPYERISAIYGKELTENELKRHVNRFHVLAAHGMMWSRGQVGCTLSHLFVYKKMVDEQIPVALVLEDDAKFSNDFHKVFDRVVEFVDVKRAQVILLSDHRDNVKQRLVNNVEGVTVMPISGDTCSEAYVVTLSAARELYRINYPMVETVDAWTRYRKRGHIELYRSEPPVVKQNRTDFVSNIDMPKPNVGLRKVVWKIWRLCGVVVDNLWYYLLHR